MKLRKEVKIIIYILLIFLFSILMNNSLNETNKRVNNCLNEGLTLNECNTLYK